MDESWVQETQSAATFPLPFRVLFLLSSGVLGWATNLHGLHLHAIDYPSVLYLHRPALPTTRSPGSSLFVQPTLPYRPVYRLFFHCAAWCLFTWFIYRYSTLHHVEYIDVFKYLPLVGALGLVIGLVCPFDVLELREREKFLSCVERPFSVHFVKRILAHVVLYTGALRLKDPAYPSPTSFWRTSSRLMPKFSGTFGFPCGCYSPGVVCSFYRPRMDGPVGF